MLPKEAAFYTNHNPTHPCLVPVSSHSAIIHLPFKHLKLASLQKPASLYGPGPTWISAISSLQKDCPASSRPQYPHTTAIHRLPGLPAPLSPLQLNLYLSMQGVGLPSVEGKSTSISLFNVSHLLKGRTCHLLLFTVFKQCDSWLWLDLSKQQGIRWVWAFRYLLPHWEKLRSYTVGALEFRALFLASTFLRTKQEQLVTPFLLPVCLNYQVHWEFRHFFYLYPPMFNHNFQFKNSS